jgi:hypothetical protein
VQLLAGTLKIRARSLEFVLRLQPFLLHALELFLTALKRCLRSLELVKRVLPFFLDTPELVLIALKSRLGTLEFPEGMLPLVKCALKLRCAALKVRPRTLEPVVCASEIFLRTGQLRLCGDQIPLHPLVAGLEARSLAVRALQIRLDAFAIRLRALTVGLDSLQFGVRAFEVGMRTFAFRLRPFEVGLRPCPLGGDGFLQLTASLGRQFSRRLLGLLPDPQGLGDQGALDVGPGGCDFGLQTGVPLPAHVREFRRPPLFGVDLGETPRLDHRLFVGLGEPSEMRLELGVQARANAVDDGAKLILGHSLALSGRRSGKSSSENAASSRPTAT